MFQEYSDRVFQSLRSLPLRTKFNYADIASDRPQALQGNNRNYQKFVVLAHQRSGSSMVITSLREHPQMVVFSELFVPQRIFFHLAGFDNDSAKLLAFRDARPVDFLQEYIFSPYREDIKAVGFKLFPDQIDKRRFRCLWEWIEQNRDLKIIYLTRRDLLATYASLLIAQKDRKYAIKDQSERSRTTVTIDPKACLAEFQRRTRYEEAVDRIIQRHDVMRWCYEDLAAAPEQQLKQAQEFLGVEVCDPKIKMVKQEVRPLPEVIENYRELRQYFFGTPWEYLFQGQPVEEHRRTPNNNDALPEPAAGGRHKQYWNDARIDNRRKKFTRRTFAGIAISLCFAAALLLNLAVNKAAPVAKTVSAIRDAASRIGMYVQTHRALPKALNILPVDNDRENRPIDGWDQPLSYQVEDDDAFTIISPGPDGVIGGAHPDDIVCKYQVVNGEVHDIQ